MYVQLDARLIKKGYKEIVYSWKSSELESAEQYKEKSIKSYPRSNSVFAQFSVVCMFNWMLGQLRKAVGRSFLEGRSYVRNLLTEGGNWTSNKVKNKEKNKRKNK